MNEKTKKLDKSLFILLAVQLLITLVGTILSFISVSKNSALLTSKIPAGLNVTIVYIIGVIINLIPLCILSFFIWALVKKKRWAYTTIIVLETLWMANALVNIPISTATILLLALYLAVIIVSSLALKSVKKPEHKS